jgi:D-alanyl-D-alanine carboxypeptidase
MGKALDVTVNGSTIQSRKSAAYQWIAKNGSKYGLINFPKEAWHWSYNGK